MASYALVCHPLILSGVATAIDTVRTFPSSSVTSLAPRWVSAWQSALMFSVVDHYIYGNVLFTLATVCLLPQWTLLYLTIFSEKEPEKLKEE